MVNRLLKLFFLFSGLAGLFSCSQPVKNGRLLQVDPQPENGFNFPYLLFIPEGMDTTRQQVMIVEPNNSGFVSDDPEKHLEKAKRTACLDFYTGNYVSRKTGYPLLVPVIPRWEKSGHVYTHAFDRDMALQRDNILERIDLQLLSMVDDARKRLASEGYSFNNKFLMTGFSASGTFVNRFTAIHPERVLAAAGGGVNGLLILPIRELENERLNFPLGINDFPVLFNKPFDSAAFQKIPQMYYMGELDANDAVPYDDAYDAREREQVYKLLGNEMQPRRWQNCRDIYARKKINARVKTYAGIGHEQHESVKNEIADFFKSAVEGMPPM